MSRNEKKFFEEYENDGAVIYRVYNFDKSTRRGLIKIITATDLLNNYYFDPITFAVKEKWFIIIKNHSQILLHTNKNKDRDLFFSVLLLCLNLYFIQLLCQQIWSHNFGVKFYLSAMWMANSSSFMPNIALPNPVATSAIILLSS